MKRDQKAPGRKPEPHDDRYWDDEWQRTQETLKERERARARAWLSWQKEQEGRARYSPWLVIPCTTSDYGLRPLTSGIPWWASPFISVESPDPSGQALAGAENHLLARVFNLGAATAAPTRVDFYWADPSVGLGPADAHFIGTEWVEVQPMTSRVVRCAVPWVPSYLNGGHECAFVLCDNHVLDPMLAPFQPWADRHVGQRNLAVLPSHAQAFQLWAAGGTLGAPAELRVTALRGIMHAEAMHAPLPAMQVLSAAVYHLLAGLRPQAATARRAEGNMAMRRPPVVAERIAAERVIAGVRHVDAIRKVADAGDAGTVPGRGDGALMGERMTQIDAAPGTAQLIELQLHAVDLEENELVVLDITQVVAGTVRGGYVVALARPHWFRKSPLFPLQGDAMKDQDHGTSDDALREMVIEQFPQAQLALAIAQALQKHLPITSLDDARRIAKEVRIGRHHLDAGTIDRFASKELLPISDVRDLVRKVVGLLNIALQVQHQPGTLPPETAAFLTDLGRPPGSRSAPIPSAQFVGPSIFGSTPAKGA